MTDTTTMPAASGQASTVPVQNASHTVGPWEHAGNGLVYGRCTSEEDESPFVCDVISDEAMRAMGILSSEEQANARLIAAAPRMLQVLEHMVAWAELHGLTTAELITGGQAEVPVIGLARAAIAEAKGLAA